MKIPVLIVLTLGVAAPQSAPPGSKGAASPVGYLLNKQICLDGVINTVEKPFLHMGEVCSLFVVSLPLAPEDAQLLTGNATEDDQLLSRMHIQYLNSTTFQVM